MSTATSSPTHTLASTTRRLLSMVRWDVRLQFRYGFYAAYAVLTIAYALALRVAPTDVRPLLLVFVIFNDPVVLGLYFVAALVLFEKGDGVLDVLVTSPLSARAYLASKVVSLSLLAVLATLVLAAIAVGTRFDPLVLVVGVGLTSALFVLLGFVLVARFDTLNAYFLVGTATLSPLAIPLLGTFGLV
ncbi:MAG TPA: ABC transporter permease, partial [Halobacteriales archaeon]|nr:ABC transporter permease [Halobacteriales archaeon]